MVDGACDGFQEVGAWVLGFFVRFDFPRDGDFDGVRESRREGPELGMLELGELVVGA